jgi:hypothetical protein
MKRALMSIALSAAFAGAAYAVPVQLITNGDFESGTLAGWTVNNTGAFGNNFYAIANGGGVPVSGQPTAVLSGGGNFVAVSDQNGGGGEELRQGFTVAAETTSLILEFDWFNNTHIGQFGTAINGSEQVGRIDILSAGAAPLDTGAGVAMNLRLNVGTVTSFGTTIPWVHETFDLSGLAPGNYEVRFGNGQCCFYQELGVDNVSLLAVPEPATTALLGLGLAGIGFVRRRRIGREQVT